jgi:hypothetical protein
LDFMKHDRIEIKLSKTKTILALLGSIAFVVLCFWLLTIADEQERYEPIVAKGAAWLGIVFFGICGIYIFFKLFDTKPGLVIDAEGILDNSSAASFHRVIKWEEITGVRMEQIMTTKFILIEVINAHKLLNEMSKTKRMMVKTNLQMYGTPITISTTTLKTSAKELLDLLNEQLRIRKGDTLQPTQGRW